MISPAPTTDNKPTIDYVEPRLWAVRIFTRETGIAGYGFIFKAPYGTSFTATQALHRAATVGQIVRFTIGPASKAQLAKLDRSKLERFDEAFERAGLALGIRWES